MHATKAFFVIASLVLVGSTSRVAAACVVEPITALPADLSVAAPEMRRTANVELCLTAQQVIAAALAKTALPTATVAAGAAPSSSAGADSGYVPKTQHDNTPWRFDMNQNGKRMTAEEFDAWMKTKGIHVATGKAAVTAGEPGTQSQTQTAQ